MRKFLKIYFSSFRDVCRSGIKAFLGSPEEGFRFGQFRDSMREELFFASSRREIFQRFYLVAGLIWLLYLLVNTSLLFLSAETLTNTEIIGWVCLLLLLPCMRTSSFSKKSIVVRQIVFLMLLYASLTIQFVLADYPYSVIFFLGTLLVSMQVLEVLRMGVIPSLVVTYSQFIFLTVIAFRLDQVDQWPLDVDIVFVILTFAWLIILLSGSINLVRREIRYRTEFLGKELVKSKNNQLEMQKIELQQLVTTDPLTGVLNRRGFEQHFHSEWRRASRYGYSLLLIYMDIDFFKLYNDRYGHQKGDDCLRKVASILKENARRPGELVCRYGGEEFLVCYPLQGKEKPDALLFRLLEVIRVGEIAHEDSPTGALTVSLGGVFFDPPSFSIEASQEQIKRADSMLYRAKSQGRNQFFLDDQIMGMCHGSSLFK